MAAISPKDFDQFIRFAMTCNVIAYVQTSTAPIRYTVFAGPLDMVVTNVTQANLDKAKAALTSMEEVASIA